MPFLQPLANETNCIQGRTSSGRECEQNAVGKKQKAKYNENMALNPIPFAKVKDNGVEKFEMWVKKTVFGLKACLCFSQYAKRAFSNIQDCLQAVVRFHS
eukprot:TRINITY_DN942_c0_g1_i2.p2 TRINITY_DN942_c0_g1~~TRINITY_DN942_c0_g1_i2.p2  ORF type:complete len:100 (+),score=0.12 TRINITY_DN942_c0_g1_i2:289-588(+)